MRRFAPLLIALFIFDDVHCEDLYPRAHGLGRSSSSNEIRRAPVRRTSSSSFAPLAKSLRPASTGVRRAPLASSARPVPVQQGPMRRAPMSARRAPPPPPLARLPQPPPQLQIPFAVPQFVPVPVPMMMPVAADQHAFQMPTLAPHVFTPIPGLPTLPGLTMPPSFQRLLGITTTPRPDDEPESVPAPAPSQTRRRQLEVDEPEPAYSVERGALKESKDLATVRSRLPKFVRDSSEAGKAEDNADWIVPFH